LFDYIFYSCFVIIAQCIYRSQKLLNVSSFCVSNVLLESAVDNHLQYIPFRESRIRTGGSLGLEQVAQCIVLLRRGGDGELTGPHGL
jgi:hypothetical protein